MQQAAALDLEPIVEYDELHQRVDDGDTSAVLLNVLPRAAFEAGRIPSSVNLPLEELAERAADVLPARGQETIVYCASSTCTLARQGTIILRNLGYENVREYRSGMEEWTDRHGRIERDASSRPAEVQTGRGRWQALFRAPAAAFGWASGQRLAVLFAIWLGTSALFALIYWLGGGSASALLSDNLRLKRDFAALVTAFGFSVATALSTGYGTVAAVGWMRLAVLAETGAGLILFTALISKILNSQQETLLSEIHRLTYENRLVRVRTNLHLLLAELAEISGECANPAVPARRLRARIESVAAIFAGELAAVRDLVDGPRADADDSALDALFACLAAGLEEMADLLTCLPAGQDRSPSLRRSLRTVAQLGGDLGGAFTSTPRAVTVVRKMDRVQRVCHALSDELRIGDVAPAFMLPASDGLVHQLSDHFGRPIVLLWFPKAFTGG
jgi:rhodanese-related sulfurtransferase